MSEPIVKGLREARRSKIAEAKRKINVRNKDPKFEYRVVNDIHNGQRIATMEELGWVVDDKTTAGDKAVNKPTKEGSPNKISVGQGTQAYVMKIPKEIYAEDQAIKQEEVDQLESGLKSNDNYGSIKIDKSEVNKRR